MPGLDNKLSNVLATALPTWLIRQLNTRANKNSLQTRDNENLVYLANKTGWIRVVSSINISNDTNACKDPTYAGTTYLGDIKYFRDLTGLQLTDPTDLAKQFVLYGGMSKYRKDANNPGFTYNLRSGIQQDGSYGMLGSEEVKKYGYKPMPGITDATIETMGKLGSVRYATINFKVSDKDQLDVVDALYFKLGYSMLIEWGHTTYYAETADGTQTTLQDTELLCIDPFQQDATKEKINAQIYKNTRESQGNYEAMLGIVSNYHFSMNQDGGYDCSIKVVGLGVLGDSIKANQTKELPELLIKEIKKYINRLRQIEEQKQKEEADRLVEEIKKKQLDSIPNTDLSKIGINDPFANLLFNLKLLNTSYKLTEQLSQPSTSTLPGDINIQTGQSADATSRAPIVTNIAIPIENAKNKIQNKIEQIKNAGYLFSSSEIIGGSFDKKYIFFESKDSKPYIYFSELKKYITKDEKIKVILDINKINSFFGITTSNLNQAIKDYNNAKSFNNSYTFITGVFSITLDFSKDVNFDFSKSNIQYEIESIEAADYQNETFGYLTITLSTNDGKSKIRLGRPNKGADSGPKFADLNVIKDIVYLDGFENLTQNKLLNKVEAEIQKAEQAQQEPLPKVDQIDENQIRSALSYQSAIELILKAIQLYSINNTLLTGANYQGKTVFPVYLMDKKNSDFYKSIMSIGVFSSFADELYNTTNINLNNYPNGSRLENLKIQAKYGFNSSVMLMQKDDFTTIKPVDFKSLMTSYVIPYNKSQTIIEDVNLNIEHPVYIQFGFLLMLLNNMCVLYDSKIGNSSTDQVPLVYIDFHPETNFCLSAPEQLSIDVTRFLIPFQGTRSSYAKLFDGIQLTTDSGSIQPSGSESPIPLFDPTKEDGISGKIPGFKFASKDSTEDYRIIQSTDGAVGYRGKIMNVLINIEYILETIKTFVKANGSNDVYVKPFIEKILSDMNKSFGDFNVFRLSYNDASNTFVITDDQYTPGIAGEQIQRTEAENRTELPIYGKYSIAKSLELRSEVSSKLSSMIAISSNADAKYAMSTDATSFGFVNSNYVDRYINNKTEISLPDERNKQTYDSIRNSAILFNDTIRSYYGTANPTEDSLGHATNYYIQKMSKIKAEGPTRSSVLIPLSLNFTTDGIAGFRIGNGFTISDKFLPYTYNQRTAANPAQQKVGFCVVGVTHTISENTWNTSVRSHMIYLKDQTDFKAELNETFAAEEVIDTTNIISSNATIPTNQTDNIKQVISSFKQLKYNDAVIAGFLGNFSIETSFSNKAIFGNTPDPANNSIINTGLAQWNRDRRDLLITRGGLINIKNQVDYVDFELNDPKFLKVKSQLQNIPNTLDGAKQAAEIIRRDYEVASTENRFSKAYQDRIKLAGDFWKELQLGGKFYIA